MIAEYDDFLKSLSNDDVFELFQKLFQFGRIKCAIEESFREPIREKFTEQLQLGPKIYVKLHEGVDCRILQAGSDGWKKGKLKISINVEFIPDEPETNQYQSPLDEIRQEIQQNGGV
jgi:hypothetical protein